ncbi:Protein ECERIFERUM 1 [Capsicum baccatum]|uniref:Protein ECERIFERUM 1 n=1 Tax=Capsicum baccatum TaxID=33114 RepID=A0A2G2WWX1_CAPBA|nr:Protein ECERIFERUM 1 [Capsicum baccatum]
MASNPGILTEWPWTWLGNFKYVVLAPFVANSIHSFFMSEDKGKRDIGYLIIFPFLLFRMLHNQIWISLSRYRTAKGDNRIVDKTIEFDQVDRERNWDDQIILNGLLFYYGYMKLEQSHHIPLWSTNGIIMTVLLHIGPVEFLYYWLHRALHHHFLYSRYHSHHHSSIATEPITSVIHPFAEHIAYFLLFAIPLLTTVLTRTASIVSFGGYITYIDFMNNMGHCNFEIIPKWMFSSFPPLKYLMYTPSYHSLHHTQFRTNYSLFMPMYDYIYNTLDKSSDMLYEKSLERQGQLPDVVHLTHLTTPESIYHLRLGIASFASEPYTSKWYFWLMWPVTLWSMIVTWIYGTTQVVLGGHLSKVANAIALALCQGGEKVMTLREEEYKKLKSNLSPEAAANLVPSKNYASKIWLVGDGLSEDEQLKAPKGTLFIPFSQFPPRKVRKDCFYLHTPAMVTPKHFENVDSCENWLPRRVMSAWRVAGILHALEDWQEHECGSMMFDIEKVWKASLDHGFQPITIASAFESKA